MTARNDDESRAETFLRFSRRGFLWSGFAGLLGFGFIRKLFATEADVKPGRNTMLNVRPGTDPQSLKDLNPKFVDASELEVTPMEQFDTMGLEDHEVDLDTWRLKITGEIETPVELTYEEVKALPAIEKKVLLICPGVFVINGMWKGFSGKELLKRIGSSEKATHVTFSGPAGPYAKHLRVPLYDVLSDSVFLAYGANGRTMPQKHGFPLRLVAEGWFGYEWVKFVDSITVDRIET